MTDLVQIAKLGSETQAQLLEAALEERGIPCVIRSYHDSAYDGVFQTSWGWGHVEADPKHRTEILEIIRELEPGE